MARTLLITGLLLTACAAAASTPLADAAEAGDTARVQRLLLEGANPAEAQADGMTALHWAVRRADEQSVSRLLIAGADTEAATRYGVTPLGVACESGLSLIARQLLVAGADPNRCLAGGVSPLHLASRAGDRETVVRLIQAGAKVNAAERRGTTALMWASAAGHADVIDALLEAEAEIDKSTSIGFNALMFAAREGRLEAIEHLIAAGANVDAVTHEKKRGGERGPRPRTSALLMAVESAHYETALRLVDLGADPNDQRNGFAPLHTLSWTRRPQSGDNAAGDPPPRGSGSVPPLRFVDEIVARGADVNLKLNAGKGGHAAFNPKGATPFLMAALTADLPLMQTLLNAGADPLIKSDDQTTALMAAAGVGAKSVGEHPGTEEEVLAAVRYLVELGVGVNAVNENNQTAMHGAAYRNYPRVVTLLAELGADPAVWNLKNHHGSTPEQIAQGKRPGSLKPSPETVEALRAAKQARQGKLNHAD